MSTAEYVNVHEAALRLAVHPRTVLRAIHRGELSARRVGSVWRIPVRELEAAGHQLTGAAFPLRFPTGAGAR